jgi:hypothetical protein
MNLAFLDALSCEIVIPFSCISNDRFDDRVLVLLLTRTKQRSSLLFRESVSRGHENRAGEFRRSRSVDRM